MPPNHRCLGTDNDIELVPGVGSTSAACGGLVSPELPLGVR